MGYARGTVAHDRRTGGVVDKEIMMKLLGKDQLKEFDVILNQKLCCKSREFNKLFIEGNITDETLLQVEIFLKMECPEFHMLVCQYQDHCIRKANDKSIIDDPTTQE